MKIHLEMTINGSLEFSFVDIEIDDFLLVMAEGYGKDKCQFISDELRLPVEVMAREFKARGLI